MTTSATVTGVTDHRIDPADLVDVAQVATLLGLSNQKGVGIYRSRHADFPQPVVVASSGRCLLWLRQDIEAWRAIHPTSGRTRDGDAPIAYPDQREAHGHRTEEE